MQTILLLLIILWAFGFGTGYAAGGLIHLLLVVAVVIFLYDYIQGRRQP